MAFENARPVVHWLTSGQSSWTDDQPGLIVGLRAVCQRCGTIYEAEEHRVLKEGDTVTWRIQFPHVPWAKGSRGVSYYEVDLVEAGDPAMRARDLISVGS